MASADGRCVCASGGLIPTSSEGVPGYRSLGEDHNHEVEPPREGMCMGGRLGSVAAVAGGCRLASVKVIYPTDSRAFKSASPLREARVVTWVGGDHVGPASARISRGP